MPENTQPEYRLEELTKEEMENLTVELQEVLERYNCDMGVRSSIEILKRVPVTKEEETPTTPDEFIIPEETTEETA